MTAIEQSLRAGEVYDMRCGGDGGGGGAGSGGGGGSDLLKQAVPYVASYGCTVSVEFDNRWQPPPPPPSPSPQS